MPVVLCSISRDRRVTPVSPQCIVVRYCTDFFTKEQYMSKLTRAFRQSIFMLLTMLPLLASAAPISSTRTRLVQRLDRLHLPLSLPDSETFTQRKIADYLEYGGPSTEKMLGRADQYFPIFEYYLCKYDMPASLKYLSVAESMLQPGVVSPASAAGLWQLMPATAREMGLRVDAQIDERFDLHRSTEAAVLMLRNLHLEFGDWTLALAAYNAGAGRVKRAIRSAGSTEYAKVNAFLPGETRRYVSAYLAAAYALNYYQDHNLSPRGLPAVSSIRIFERTNLSKVARAGGVRLSTLIRMNPVFVQHLIPTSERGYLLRVPQEHYEAVKLYFWGRPNLVELLREDDLNIARSVSVDMNFDPTLLLTGCRSEHLIYDVPAGRLALLGEQMMLNVYKNQRAYASL